MPNSHWKKQAEDPSRKGILQRSGRRILRLLHACGRKAGAAWMGAAMLIGAVVLSPGVWLLWRGSPDSQGETLSSAEESVASSRGVFPPSVHVGTSACVECHAREYNAYLRTGHSRAMSVVDAAVEPPDAVYDHHASGRQYQITRRNGQLWHSESLSDARSLPGTQTSNLQTLRAEHPLQYLVGSGRHSRTYLIEQNGFLAESPVTWYASTQSWAMSPGYEGRWHVGFERAADTGCLTCHVGGMQVDNQSIGRAAFSELSIGCERCHGSGAAHVAHFTLSSPRSSSKTASNDRRAGHQGGQPDILHPGRLGRKLQEAICADCHLRGDATVFRTGFGVGDFAPGQPLTNVRLDYHLATNDGNMKVVGHMAQMHASTCYQMSETLTCTTCHDPHAEHHSPAETDQFKAVCLKCHGQTACRMELPDRLQVSPKDDCVSCHMPQVETDIPHIAFTHHRIGVHSGVVPTEAIAQETAQVPTDTTAGVLQAFGDLSGVPQSEQDRGLGLAYAELAYQPNPPAASEHYRRLAIQLLGSLITTKSADSEVLSTMARFAWEDRDSNTAFRLAQKALQDDGITAKAKANSLFIIGDWYLQTAQHAAAVHSFQQLTLMRRNSEDWLLLGLAQLRCGQLTKAITAIQQGLKIQPFRPQLHEAAAELYRSTGSTELAEQHTLWAQQLADIPEIPELP